VAGVFALGKDPGASEGGCLVDAAYAAAQSWPDANPRFVWPPQERKRPGPSDRFQAPFEDSNPTATMDTTAERAAQRACATALRRACELEALGLGDRAETLRQALA
jgi:hypothetical protein